MPLKFNCLKRICDFTCFTPEKIKQIANYYCSRYKRYIMPKKNGGTREISHPAQKLKILQYAVYETILVLLPTSEIATAYIRGKKSPLLATAKPHRQYKYTIRIDFKDFFPSIIPNDLFNILISNKYNISSQDKNLISKILFIYTPHRPNGSLPIGAPSSPIISNIVMYELDNKIFNLAHQIDSYSAISRYADDIYFSTNKKGLCNTFFVRIKTLLRNFDSPNLTINTKKTLYLSRGTRRIITGLFITPEGNITIGRQRKENIKRLIYKYGHDRLTKEEIRKAQGIIAYITDTEPNFANKLAMKYEDFYFNLRKTKP